jgi:hypothetical protein
MKLVKGAAPQPPANDDEEPLENVAIIRDGGMTLVTEDDCMPITVGQRLTCRGQECFAITGRAPNGRSSGNIAVSFQKGAEPAEVYPGSVKARWIKDETLDAILAAAGDQLH